MKVKYALICEHCGRLFNKPKRVSTQTRYVLCTKHRIQFKKYNKFLDTNQWCQSDSIYDIIDNYVRIHLFDKVGNFIAYGYCDLKDINLIKSYRWYIGSHGYMVNNKLGLFHKNLIDSPFIDHINRDRLDNRRSNLRPCTRSDNQVNRTKQKNNKSGVTGVYYNTRDSVWIARLERYEIQHVKKFLFFEDAVRQRLLWEKEYFGDFAPQKHLFEKYNIK